MKVPVRGPEAESYWRQQINELRRSGLTKVEYCRKHHLQHHSLSYWITKLKLAERQTAPGARFAKVIVTSEAGSLVPEPSGKEPARQSCMVLAFPGGVTLHIDAGFDVGPVAALIAAVGGRK